MHEKIVPLLLIISYFLRKDNSIINCSDLSENILLDNLQSPATIFSDTRIESVHFPSSQYRDVHIEIRKSPLLVTNVKEERSLSSLFRTGKTMMSSLENTIISNLLGGIIGGFVGQSSEKKYIENSYSSDLMRSKVNKPTDSEIIASPIQSIANNHNPIVEFLPKHYTEEKAIKMKLLDTREKKKSYSKKRIFLLHKKKHEKDSHKQDKHNHRNRIKPDLSRMNRRTKGLKSRKNSIHGRRTHISECRRQYKKNCIPKLRIRNGGSFGGNNVCAQRYMECIKVIPMISPHYAEYDSKYDIDEEEARKKKKNRKNKYHVDIDKLGINVDNSGKIAPFNPSESHACRKNNQNMCINVGNMEYELVPKETSISALNENCGENTPCLSIGSNNPLKAVSSTVPIPLNCLMSLMNVDLDADRDISNDSHCQIVVSHVVESTGRRDNYLVDLMKKVFNEGACSLSVPESRMISRVIEQMLMSGCCASSDSKIIKIGGGC